MATKKQCDRCWSIYDLESGGRLTLTRTRSPDVYDGGKSIAESDVCDRCADEIYRFYKTVSREAKS